MRRSDDDAAAVGHGFRPRCEEERLRSRVHCRPDGVGPETQQQLEHLFIRFRSDDAEVGWLVGAVAPRPQRPVLVVEEYAAKLYRCPLCRTERVVDGESVAALRCHIAPPYPRAHTCPPRHLEESVGRPSPVGSHDDYLIVTHGDMESIGHRQQRVDGHTSGSYLPALRWCRTVEFDDTDGGLRGCCRHRTLTRHRLHIGGEHAGSDRHHGVGGLGNGHGDGVDAVVPEHFPGRCRGRHEGRREGCECYYSSHEKSILSSRVVRCRCDGRRWP